MTKSTIRIATRSSPLALWQANAVKRQLEKAHNQLTVELVPLVTEGDRFLEKPLIEAGGKGLFIKELEYAILKKQADIAVHSVKDMPAQLPDAFCLAAVCQRTDPHDVLILNNRYKTLGDLPKNAIVGTSSLRRQCQIKAFYPHLQITSLRGNIDTRVRKLQEGQFDAIVLAAAGLKRLKIKTPVAYHFSAKELLPAIGQGAIGIECRHDDKKLLQYLKALDHAPSHFCILAERAVSYYLGGSCTMPLAAYAELNDEQLTLNALIGQPDGKIILRAKKIGHCQQAEALGKTVADDLLRRGAQKIIERINIK